MVARTVLTVGITGPIEGSHIEGEGYEVMILYLGLAEFDSGLPSSEPDL